MIWKDSQFTLKENVLGMYRDAYPLIEERDKLIFESTKNIDRSVILNYERQIRALNKTRNELSIKIERAKEKNNKVAEALEKELLKIENQIIDLTEKYETDSAVNSINQFYNSKVLSCGVRLVLNKDLISRMMPLILDGDTSVLDYDNEECIKDVVGVAVSDFFHVMKQRQLII